jgi:hypothetical protein
VYLGWRGVSRVAAPVPGRPGSVAGGHVREPYTVFNAETRGRRAVASVASHDSKPSLRGVSGAWRWTSIRLFPALTDPGQRDMLRPAAGVRGRARDGSDRRSSRRYHSSSRCPFVLARPTGASARAVRLRAIAHLTRATGARRRPRSGPGVWRRSRFAQSRPSGSAFVGLRGLYIRNSNTL